MSIDQVPSAFQADVKKELGIQDVVEEQPVEESAVETTPVEETTEQPTVGE